MGSLPVWCLDINVHTLRTVRRQTDWHKLWWWAPSEVQHCLSRFKTISAAKAQSAQWSVESWKLHHGKQQSNKRCVSLATLTMGSSKLNMIVAASKTGKNASYRCTEPSTGGAVNWKGTWSDSKLPFLRGACASTLQVVVTLRHGGKKASSRDLVSLRLYTKHWPLPFCQNKQIFMTTQEGRGHLSCMGRPGSRACLRDEEFRDRKSVV